MHNIHNVSRDEMPAKSKFSVQGVSENVQYIDESCKFLVVYSFVSTRFL